jgi:two-component system, response regulator YesN
LRDVSEHLNLNDSYFSKIFKDELKIGFSDYLCDLRLEKAKAVLGFQNIEIKEAAGMCGFNNYAYFFSIFKKKLGITPKEYINNVRRNM